MPLLVEPSKPALKQRRASQPSAKTSWPTAWDDVAMPHSGPGAIALIGQCAKRLDSMVSRTESLVAAGRIRKAKQARRRMLSSASARIAAMNYAAERLGVKWPAESIVQEALKLDMRRLPFEPVRLVYKERSDGTFRPVFRLSIRGRARDMLGARVARIFTRFGACQFGGKGGTPAIADWLSENVSSTTIVTTTDIPSCFLVLNRTHIETDGLLPTPVLQSLLFHTMSVAEERKGLTLYGGSLSGIPKEGAFYGPGHCSGRGVPPGSALAALVAEQRLGALISAVEMAVPDVKVASYSDNFIILAHSTEASRAAKVALHFAVQSEYGADVANEVRDRMNTKAAKFGFVFLKDHYRLTSEGLRRRMTQGALDWATRFPARSYERGWTPEQQLNAVLGWMACRSYDPRTFERGRKLIGAFGLKGTVADMKAAAAPTWGPQEHFWDIDDDEPWDV